MGMHHEDMQHHNRNHNNSAHFMNSSCAVHCEIAILCAPFTLWNAQQLAAVPVRVAPKGFQGKKKLKSKSDFVI